MTAEAFLPPSRKPAPASARAGSPIVDAERDALRQLLWRNRAALGVTVEASDIVLIGPVRTGRYSLIYRADIPQLETPLAVKKLVIPDTPQPDVRSTRGLFASMERVHRAMPSDAEYRFPIPYFASAEDGVIVTEWIDGRTLTEAFRSPWTSLGEARALMSRAGRWLRVFADADAPTVEPLDVGDKLAGVRDMENGPLARFPAARDALAALRRHAAPVSSFGLQHSWLHGDFKTDNLLVNDRSVVGIDVQVAFRNAVVHDLASFVGHWKLSVCHPRACRWLPWRSELADRFIASFDPVYLGAQRLPYRWVALHVMLGSWEEFAARRRNGFDHAYVSACFRTLIRRMTRRLDDAARSAG